MPNNYNLIAPFYDLLSRIVFGRTLVQAQVCLLKFVPRGSRVLIVGGGTGWILEELAEVHPQGLTVTYIERSARMISRSKKRSVGQNEVTFVSDSIENFTAPAAKYNIIITPFFFDNFKQEKAEIIFNQLHESLANGGLWLFADFYLNKKSTKSSQKMLLKMMYLFFRISCHIEASHLPETASLFSANNYREIFKEARWNGFIQSIAYAK